MSREISIGAVALAVYVIYLYLTCFNKIKTSSLLR